MSEECFRDHCGVFGIYSKEEDSLPKSIYLGLFALQHRGQESAGMALSNGESITLHKGLGLVNVVFSEQKLSELKGRIALGHVRYSTAGGSGNVENAQPIVVESKFGPLAVAHNGNLLNYRPLRQQLLDQGYVFKGDSDTEVIAAMLAVSQEATLEKAIEIIAKKIRGAFAIGILTKDKLIGLRDPHGIRPLCVGKTKDRYVISSETCALDIVGASLLRDIGAGEMVIIDENGLSSKTYSQEMEHECLCVFEFIYFARPDSIIDGRSLYQSRVTMGKYLAKEYPAKADMVIAMPDSGTPAAIGFAAESGIPYGEGLIKNRYVGRTFIQPEQAIRELGVKMKLNPIRDNIHGKKIVLVDDSIVRGTTSRKIVKLLKEYGAREVHMRVSSPPITHPCFYGIDTPSRSELIAANLSIEGIRKYMDADSLGYLSLKGLVKAIGLPKDSHCLACLNGDYPVRVPEEMESLKFFQD